ncbi:MAG: leucine-rich repeat protein [Paludibacteraceae bacterium]|nr:leucine-rich repeat protein [Paludibacteraceae bacterium]
MKHKLLFLVLSLLFISKNVLAYDFEVDGIYYGLETTSMTAYVTGATGSGGGYSGNIIIPSKVTYNTKELDVTAIHNKAFYGCNISSITIPNSIVSIGESAFYVYFHWIQ